MSHYRLGELFCGAGGLAYGAKIAEIKNKNYSIVHQWAVDYDRDACDTYIKNICPNNPKSVKCIDVRELDLNILDDIDGLSFGFPCNDYSIIGKQKGLDGLYGSLYLYGIDALKKFSPIWFVAENVDGIRSANNKKAFTKILNDMCSAGYLVTPHLYKFENYGIPQSRHRIIIVGIKKGINIKYKIPSPEPYSKIDNTCRKAINYPLISINAFNNELTKQSKVVIERLKHIKAGENAFNANLPEHLKLNIRGAKISQIYKRLDPNKPSYTLTASGGGGTHVYHWEEHRALTNRERARLQTFPDNYIFLGSKESVRKQIGMAVPCQGAKIIFESILNSFAGIAYDYVEPNI